MLEGPDISVLPRHEDHSILHIMAHPSCRFHCLGWSPLHMAARSIGTSFSDPGWPSASTKLIEMEPKQLLGKMVAYYADK